jgi:hypothetical protein
MLPFERLDCSSCLHKPASMEDIENCKHDLDTLRTTITRRTARNAIVSQKGPTVRIPRNVSLHHNEHDHKPKPLSPPPTPAFIQQLGLHFLGGKRRAPRASLPTTTAKPAKQPKYSISALATTTCSCSEPPRLATFCLYGSNVTQLLEHLQEEKN